MSKTLISPADLGAAIAEKLDIYCDEVVETVNAEGEKAIKRLVHLTRISAPKRSGEYAKSITYTESANPVTKCKRYTWGAKAPHSRLTHLLVNGHPTVNGGRVPGDPFLEDALDEVLPAYEAGVEEALKND